MRGIEEIAVGRRLGVIGSAISRCAKGYGLSVVVNYGGHGIGLDRNGVGVPHEPPFICNVGDPNEGVRIVEGMVLALEPLFVIGKSSRTRVLDDKWTVVCDDICSHHEHSIFVHRDGIEIVSYRNNENCLKSNMVYFKKNNEKIEQ
jgi:methionyl aminopeptidase